MMMSRQQRRKINVTLFDNDTIEYQQVIEYFFRPDKSSGTEDDEISVINLPFVVRMRIKQQVQQPYCMDENNASLIF